MQSDPKKITIVGRGTVGAISAAQLLSETRAEIDWVFDSSIPTAAVGEGTTLTVPSVLERSLDWSSSDLYEIGGTAKLGIWKENWGSGGKFLHPFPMGRHGIHMCATDLQDRIFDKIKGDKRITIKDEFVSNPHDIDSDGVLVCSGAPNVGESFCSIESVTVNACYVTQCFWPFPKFSHTLTIARPYGWVFGIPLQNRCSIGYLFNSDINSLEEVIEDVQNVFSDFGLEPSNTTNFIKFNSYRRKKNFDGKVVYNGNASFFVEPLEATSTTTTAHLTNMAHHYWRSPSDAFQDRYESMIEDVSKMIAIHYMDGSSFDTEFWRNAQTTSNRFLKSSLKNKGDFTNMVLSCIQGGDAVGEVATWSQASFKLNIEKLGIAKSLTNLIPNQKGEAA